MNAALAPGASDAIAATHYSLAEHVYICRFPQGAVLLDLKRNRYFGIDARAALALDSLLAPAPQADAAEPLAKAWIANGLVQPGPRTCRPFTPQAIDLRAPLTSLEDLAAESARVRPLDLACFVWHCARMRRALHTRTLYQIACDLQGRRARGAATARSTQISQMSDAVDRFRRLRPFAFAAHDQCLFHALALTQLLTAQRLSATWVIGVRLHPWGAHSWVQHGSLLLDATPESVREFTPIVAV